MVIVVSPNTVAEGPTSRHPVASPAVMSLLLAALRTALGPVSLIDMTLPRGMSAGIDREAIFGCGIDVSTPERHFLGRFRQSGGHREMYLPQSGAMPSGGGAELPASLDRSRGCVILVDSFAQAGPLLDVIDPRISLVVPVYGQRPPKLSPALASRLRNHRKIVCNAVDAGVTFLWFVPEAEFTIACDTLALERSNPKPSRATSGTAKPGRRTATTDATLLLSTLPDGPWHSSLVASVLIHDGGYRSERDGDYSWLWTGPMSHFRILLTGVPPTAAKLHVSVIKTEDMRNLSGLRLLINGRHAPHRFHPWSEFSGKIAIDLDPPAQDMTILSLVCPHMIPDADGGRLLGLCIDKIEMSS